MHACMGDGDGHGDGGRERERERQREMYVCMYVMLCNVMFCYAM